MIEKLAGCLRHGRRTLLHKPRGRHSCSQRQLRSAFWSHGAELIDLPAWWILLLRAPVTRNDSQGKQAKCSARGAIASQLKDIFSDILGPLQNLALIGRLQHSTSLHQHVTYVVKQCSRNYASVATALISNPQASSVTSSQMMEQDRYRKRQPNLLDLSKTLDWLIDCQPLSHPRHRPWKVCQNIIERTGSLSPTQTLKLLRCLNTSEHEVDLERTLALFESIPPAERRAVHCKYAINAALALQDVKTALYVHNEAMSRHHCSVGVSTIIAHAVASGNWTLALDVWRPFWTSGFATHTLTEIWHDIAAMPVDILTQKMLSFAELLLNGALTLGKAQLPLGREFATELVFHVLQLHIRRPPKSGFDIRQWRALLAKMIEIVGAHDIRRMAQLQNIALSGALSRGERAHDLAALNVYHSVRQRVLNLALPVELLRSLLHRCRIHHSMAFAMEILHDWRRFYGNVDKSAYRHALRGFADAGQVQPLDEAYRLYQLDHGKLPDLRILQDLLRVHYRRADPEQVTRVFLKIRANTTVKPHVRLYNIVISTFARVGDFEGAMYWFNELQQANLKPTEVTYFALMWVYSKRGDREAVQHLLEQALADGLEPDKSMIDMLVLANINDSRFEEAERLLEEALTMGLKGSLTHMWNVLLTALAFRGDLRRVKRIHNRMKAAHVQSDAQTYAALLASLCVVKNPFSAHKILQDIMPKMGVKPSVLHYATVMIGFVRVREYEKSFEVYRDMLAQNLSPNLSSQNILLRSIAGSLEPWKRSSMAEGKKSQLDLAGQIVQQTVDNVDRSELASTVPRKFVGSQRLDEAFTSTHFDFMIYLYGETGMYNRVSEAFQTYIDTASKLGAKEIESSPPMRMVSALLVAHERAGNSQEVERCWHLAVDKCGTLVRKSSVDDLSQSNWVLPARRFVINLPLQHFLGYLGRQKRFAYMITIVEKLCRAGYDLTSINWNQYVSFLCQSSNVTHQLLAFRVCESQLMPNWWGWEYMGRYRHQIRYHFRGMQTAADRSKVAVPTYATLVRLAKAYVDLGFGRESRKRGGVWELQRSGEIAKCLDAVSNIPRMDDQVQTSILYNEK